MLDGELNYTEIMIYQSFAPEQRVWRFIRYLGLGVESTDAFLWLEGVFGSDDDEEITKDFS